MNTSKPTSLIGGPYPPELEAKLAKQREQEQQMIARSGVWKGLLLEAYRSGDLGFEQYAKLCRSILRFNTPNKPVARSRWLGEAIDAALDAERENRGRGQKGVPRSIRAMALDLLEMVREKEGLPLSHNIPGNAYDRCSELFTEVGYGGICPHELERWRHKANKSRVKD